MSSTEAPAPRLRIRRATPADASTIAKIHFEAFGPGVMNKLMHPGGVSDDARAQFAGGIFPPPDKAGDTSAEVIVMVAELPAEGSQADGGSQEPAIVAFAKWKLFREAQPREEWEGAHRDMTEEQLGEGANAAVYNEFIGGLHRMKARCVKGDPHLREFHLPPIHGRLGRVYLTGNSQIWESWRPRLPATGSAPGQRCSNGDASLLTGSKQRHGWKHRRLGTLCIGNLGLRTSTCRTSS